MSDERETTDDRPERRGGAERRSGMDRRNQTRFMPTKFGMASASAAVATLASYTSSVVSARWSVPLEVASAAVGLLVYFLVMVYNRLMLPWLK